MTPNDLQEPLQLHLRHNLVIMKYWYWNPMHVWCQETHQMKASVSDIIWHRKLLLCGTSVAC